MFSFFNCHCDLKCAIALCDLLMWFSLQGHHTCGFKKPTLSNLHHRVWQLIQSFYLKWGRESDSFKRSWCLLLIIMYIHDFNAPLILFHLFSWLTLKILCNKCSFVWSNPELIWFEPSPQRRRRTIYNTCAWEHFFWEMFGLPYLLRGSTMF